MDGRRSGAAQESAWKKKERVAGRDVMHERRHAEGRRYKDLRATQRLDILLELTEALPPVPTLDHVVRVVQDSGGVTYGLEAGAVTIPAAEGFPK